MYNVFPSALHPHLAGGLGSNPNPDPNPNPNQVSLDAEYTVDLVVVGSTAVCPTTGARVGKGEGFNP